MLATKNATKKYRQQGFLGDERILLSLLSLYK